MKITFAGAPDAIEKIREGTMLLLKDFGQQTKYCTKMPHTDSLTVEVVFDDRKELSIVKKDSRVRICCGCPAHYFRGLARVFSHIGEASYVKTEPAPFTHIGLMLDCSRNAVFTTPKIKFLIRVLARLGFDELLLYMEDTYEIPGEPYFGAYRGRYTRQELQEIERYAGKFQMELIPCIQTLAHLHNVLKWPVYEAVRDTRDNLQPGKEEAYLLIEKMLTSIRDTFSTRRIHIGMDESVKLGLGNYLRENGYQKSAVLMKEHCARVLSICQKLGFTPMIWSDMFLVSNSGQSYYDVPPNADTAGWEKPEAGVGLVYWDYYHSTEAFYDGMLKLHRQLSDNVIFAGGCWSWNGIAPNYSRTLACTRAALAACRKNGISEVFCTAWMDNGAETPVDAALPGAAMFAHMGFHENPSEKDFVEEFEMASGGSWQDFRTLERFDRLFLDNGNPEAFDLEKRPNLQSENPSKYLLYQDPLLGIFDFHLRGKGVSDYYGALAEDLAKITAASTRFPYRELFSWYQCLAEVLATKGDLGIRIKNAYDAGAAMALEKISREEIPALLQKLARLRDFRENLWMHDAKPFGYELIDLRLGGVSIRLKSCKKRLDAFLENRLACLAELEEERLPYFAEGRPAAENLWQRTISGADLTDTI